MNPNNIYVYHLYKRFYYMILNKWRQVMIPLFESSIIMNPNNMYIICIKDLILN